jgi:2-polyprenyl-6-methoxyphenol hydroxylase-like FAD-dependent oxidoreductase
LRIAIIGGSIAGCATAIELIRAGQEVKLFERSPGRLVSRGAGIGTWSNVVDGLISRDLLETDFPRFKTEVSRFVCKDDDRTGGRWLGDVARPGLVHLNWAHLFAQLRQRVPDSVYRAGVEVAGFDATSSGTTVYPKGGGSETFDLLVCADGYRSIGRSFVAPSSSLDYRGMVLWRGLVNEIDVDNSRLTGVHTRAVYRGGHGLAYLIPGNDGTTSAGGRLAMWGFYLQAPAPELDSVLVDGDDRQQKGSVPFGKVHRQVSGRFRSRLADVIPPYFLDLIDRSSGTSIQAIYSVQVPVYARQRVCLVGDAGTVLPPFTGSGVLKAVGNATSLADALTEGASLDEGLAAWSRGQSDANVRLFPIAERFERHLVFESPDASAMSVTDAKAWITSLYPDGELTLPGTLTDQITGSTLERP